MSQTCIFPPSTCYRQSWITTDPFSMGLHTVFGKRSNFTWMKVCEVLTALWELFSSVGIWNLLHTRPSSFLCRGGLLSALPRSPLWLGLHCLPLYTVQHFFTLWIVLNHCFLSHWSFVFTCGIFWFPKLTLLLVSVPPLYGLIMFPLINSGMPLFPLACTACQHGTGFKTLFPFLPPENLGELHIHVWSVFF